MAKKEEVTLEVAEVEFERFADAMDIDTEIADMSSDDQAGFMKHKRVVMRAIQYGNLRINENGEAEYTPFRPNSQYKDTLVFHERSGASLMAMDGKKQGQDVAKMYAILADMCKVHPSAFSKLVGTDIKVCESLFALLMD